MNYQMRLAMDGILMILAPHLVFLILLCCGVQNVSGIGGKTHIVVFVLSLNRCTTNHVHMYKCTNVLLIRLKRGSPD